jgi:hypothetical protein
LPSLRRSEVDVDLHPRVYSKIQKYPPITYTKSSKGQTTTRRNEALRDMMNAYSNTVLIVISSAEIKKKVKVKVNKTIKFHVEWAVSKSSQLSFLSGRRGSEGDERKTLRKAKTFSFCLLLILCRSELGRAGQSCCLFFAAATAAERRIL